MEGDKGKEVRSEGSFELFDVDGERNGVWSFRDRVVGD